MTTPVVYWRPGCGFCAALFREIERDGFEVERVNIWEDEAAAAFVRKHNNGNEVVPTVAIGDTVLTNPFLAQIKEVM
ncbi:glutaredoxin domain-containing protein [Stomatohabitans albus]|uniref:glutaredoxin domain-containing protein n=1 Tax=Stomatohabitans albus TaxID=3110766 RepID=UPI00300CF2EE